MGAADKAALENPKDSCEAEEVGGANEKLGAVEAVADGVTVVGVEIVGGFERGEAVGNEKPEEELEKLGNEGVVDAEDDEAELNEGVEETVEDEPNREEGALCVKEDELNRDEAEAEAEPIRGELAADTVAPNKDEEVDDGAPNKVEAEAEAEPIRGELAADTVAPNKDEEVDDGAPNKVEAEAEAGADADEPNRGWDGDEPNSGVEAEEPNMDDGAEVAAEDPNPKEGAAAEEAAVAVEAPNPNPKEGAGPELGLEDPKAGAGAGAEGEAVVLMDKGKGDEEEEGFEEVEALKEVPNENPEVEVAACAAVDPNGEGEDPSKNPVEVAGEEAGGLVNEKGVVD
ncbi:unnamed protein product [Prunus armeniaca]